ncbi:MAG: DUF1653 domain-containing protein [Patescibacteria group bacterium]
MQLKWFSSVRYKPTGSRFLLLLSEENYFIVERDGDVQDCPLPLSDIVVKPGTYQHYNNEKFYVVVGMAYAFTKEWTGWCVVYHPSCEATYWAQTPEDFTETVTNKSGQRLARFSQFPIGS